MASNNAVAFVLGGLEPSSLEEVTQALCLFASQAALSPQANELPSVSLCKLPQLEEKKAKVVMPVSPFHLRDFLEGCYTLQDSINAVAQSAALASAAAAEGNASAAAAAHAQAASVATPAAAARALELFVSYFGQQTARASDCRAIYVVAHDLVGAGGYLAPCRLAAQLGVKLRFVLLRPPPDLPQPPPGELAQLSVIASQMPTGSVRVSHKDVLPATFDHLRSEWLRDCTGAARRTRLSLQFPGPLLAPLAAPPAPLSDRDPSAGGASDAHEGMAEGEDGEEMERDGEGEGVRVAAPPAGASEAPTFLPLGFGGAGGAGGAGVAVPDRLDVEATADLIEMHPVVRPVLTCPCHGEPIPGAAEAVQAASAGGNMGHPFLSSCSIPAITPPVPGIRLSLWSCPVSGAPLTPEDCRQDPAALSLASGTVLRYPRGSPVPAKLLVACDAPASVPGMVLKVVDRVEVATLPQALLTGPSMTLRALLREAGAGGGGGEGGLGETRARELIQGIAQVLSDTSSALIATCQSDIAARRTSLWPVHYVLLPDPDQGVLTLRRIAAMEEALPPPDPSLLPPPPPDLLRSLTAALNSSLPTRPLNLHHHALNLRTKAERIAHSSLSAAQAAAESKAAAASHGRGPGGAAGAGAAGAGALVLAAAPGGAAAVGDPRARPGGPGPAQENVPFGYGMGPGGFSGFDAPGPAGGGGQAAGAAAMAGPGPGLAGPGHNPPTVALFGPRDRDRGTQPGQAYEAPDGQGGMMGPGGGAGQAFNTYAAAQMNQKPAGAEGSARGPPQPSYPPNHGPRGDQYQYGSIPGVGFGGRGAAGAGAAVAPGAGHGHGAQLQYQGVRGYGQAQAMDRGGPGGYGGPGYGQAQEGRGQGSGGYAHQGPVQQAQPAAQPGGGGGGGAQVYGRPGRGRGRGY